MAKFLVWCPEDGEDVEDARPITAYDAEEAAEFWAERDDAESAEYRIAGKGKEACVIVQSLSGVREEFRVSGEAVPVYTAYARLPASGKQE